MEYNGKPLILIDRKHWKNYNPYNVLILAPYAPSETSFNRTREKYWLGNKARREAYRRLKEEMWWDMDDRAEKWREKMREPERDEGSLTRSFEATPAIKRSTPRLVSSHFLLAKSLQKSSETTLLIGSNSLEPISKCISYYTSCFTLRLNAIFFAIKGNYVSP